MMKLLKLAGLFSVFFILLSLTSCLKDEKVEPMTRYGIVTVQYGLFGETVLKTDYGDSFIVSVNNSGKDISMMGRIIIVFKLINEDDLVNPDKKPIKIDLLKVASITRETEILNRDSENDSLKTKYKDPILGFDRMIENGDSVVAKDGFITAAVDYRFSENLNSNRFVLFKYKEDEVKKSLSGPDTIDVYLGRNANGDVDGQFRIGNYAKGDLNYWPYYYFAFNVTKLLPEGYTKNELIMRVHYKKDKNSSSPYVMDAVKLIKYPIK